MRLLVTGGLGFIASNFIRYMLGRHSDVEITNIDSLSIGANPANLKDAEKDSRYRFVRGDITNPRLVARLVKEADVIVNSAAETHVDRSIANPTPFLKSNTVGTFAILESTRRGNPGARIVQVSTDEIYGDILEGSFKEDHRLKPSNPYAASKAAADMFALAYHRTYGLDVVITRCTNNFGPYQSPEKLIPKTIIRAHMNLPIPIYGEGRQVRDWVYVLDHCEALNQVIERGKAGEIYNISSGNEMPNIQVVESILNALGKTRDLVRFVDDRPGHDIRYSLDSSKIRSQLGWSCKYHFIDALKETTEWYIRNESWWKTHASRKMLHPTPWELKW
ncbi:dTDP-glucose 4,6-dehydratase [Candidatus Bathyarchaeota archaeon]|nr:dTDP-glucose 4,6-dehydratase [Candidatus Bathyarchaeota archaeon]